MKTSLYSRKTQTTVVSKLLKRCWQEWVVGLTVKQIGEVMIALVDLGLLENILRLPKN